MSVYVSMCVYVYVYVRQQFILTFLRLIYDTRTVEENK